MFYRVVRFVMRVLVYLLFRPKVIGRENIPKEGGVILALNHSSNWDPVLVAVTIARPLTFMAKREMFAGKLAAGFWNALYAFPVSRGIADVGAVKAALTRLKEGRVLLLFPQGRRVAAGEEADAKQGVVMLAQRARVPVVPGVILGDYTPFRRMHIVFTKPVTLEKYYGEKLDKEQMRAISEGILEQVRRLD